MRVGDHIHAALPAILTAASMLAVAVFVFI